MDTVNTIPAKPTPPRVDFIYGVRLLDAADTTFTTTSVTFSTTAVTSVTVGARLFAIDSNGLLWWATVTAVNTGTKTVTFGSGWFFTCENPTAAPGTPNPGSRVVIHDVANPLSYIIGSTTYTPAGYFRHTLGDSLTFTSVATLISPRYPASFHWDMGDGTILKGPTVTYSYQVPSSYRRVTLTVIDDQGYEHVVSRQTYLDPVDGGSLLITMGVIL